MTHPKPLWFKAKQYGWGWYPATKEGWVILIVYSLLIAVSAIVGPVAILVCTFALTPLLIFICYKTGERPRWRWGK